MPGPPVDDDARAPQPELVLLCVRRIEDVVRREEQGVDGRRVRGRLVFDRVREEPARRRAVGQGHAAEVPEDEHPPPVLVEDVPRRRHAVVALRAGVRVEEVREHHEGELRRAPARGFVLLRRRGERDHEQEDPRHAQLAPHLEVERPDPGIQRDAHEAVVQRPARVALREIPRAAVAVREHRDAVAEDHGPGEHGPKVVHPHREAEDAGEVERRESGKERDPDRGPVAVVSQRAALERGQGPAADGRAGAERGEERRGGEEARVEAKARRRRRRSGEAAARARRVGEPGLVAALERRCRSLDRKVEAVHDAVRQQYDDGDADRAAELVRLLGLWNDSHRLMRHCLRRRRL
mmetsp:Transcript_17121/g.55766  ORF Transcript_17121/g.55766 Transcript_17121/m.55766 type:complete len:351 (-) Transcript_17121:101-1153(-)